MNDTQARPEHRLTFDPRARFDWQPQAMALLARMPSGGPVVLVAPSGAGKTHLANVWARKWYRPWDCVVPADTARWARIAAGINPGARVLSIGEAFSSVPLSHVMVLDEADRMPADLLQRMLARARVWHGRDSRVLVLASDPGFSAPGALARIEVAA